MFVVVNLLVGWICFNKFEVSATDFITKMEKDASSFISSGETEANKKKMGNVTKAITDNFSGLGQLLTMVGAGVMVAVVSYMGIQYIMAPPDKQAALKQQLIGVVVAGIVIFGAYGIWKAVLGVVSNF